jgi:phosphatidylglycerophosphatase A
MGPHASFPAVLSMLSAWEIMLILVLVLGLFFATKFSLFPTSGNQRRNGSHSPPVLCGKVILLVTQGFGLGLMPVTPGTFGSILGVGFFLLLLWPGSLIFLVMGMVLSCFVAVDFCAFAEKKLGQRDPGSVVLDEIVAVTICFGSLMVDYGLKHQSVPPPSHFFSPEIWPWTLAVFVAFRFFDITKPWPVRQSQQLPGGWGVVVDDLLAAGYVNAVIGVALLWNPISR